jgi:hypothetical protein
MSTLPRNRLPVHSDPASAWDWPSWTDDVINLGLPDPDGGNDEDGWPDPADSAWWAQFDDAPEGSPPGEPTLPFAHWIRAEASMVRLQGGNAAKWLADEMDQLADLAEYLGAETPDQFLGRRESKDCGVKEDLHELGYSKGYADGKSETMDLFGRG